LGRDVYFGVPDVVCGVLSGFAAGLVGVGFARGWKFPRFAQDGVADVEKAGWRWLEGCRDFCSLVLAEIEE
jgi:hypothetical protein